MLVALALALTGCETTEQKSAQLERAAKQQRRGAPQAGLSITHQSTKVRLSDAIALHGAEGDAAVLTLHNTSDTTLRDVPVEIVVRDARGAVLYTNDAPGLASALVSLALLPAHTSALWIDDQIRSTGTPSRVEAKVGEGAPAGGAIPELSVIGSHLSTEAAGDSEIEGAILNESRVSQQELIVNAVARRGSAIVAAGRAIVPQAPASARTRFQLFFIGDPRGAHIEVAAPATTLG